MWIGSAHAVLCTTTEVNPMARILVIYYSRTGTTKRAATEIANRLGADLEGISEDAQRLGLRGYLRSALEATFQETTEIDRVVRDPSSYDLVVIGSPTWNASLSSPVRSFIRQHRGSLKAVAFFCTCGGRGGERALDQMTLEYGKDPVAFLVLREADVLRRSAGRAIHDFADRIHLAPSSGRPQTDGGMTWRARVPS